MLQRIYGTAWQTQEQVRGLPACLACRPWACICWGSQPASRSCAPSDCLSASAASPGPPLPPPCCPCCFLQLEAFRRFNEEAAQRDHRKLGMELDLFRWAELADAARAEFRLPFIPWYICM